MKKFVIVLFFLVAMLATNYALLNGTFFRVHDYVHAARIAEMLRALQDGHFPVRWTKDFGFGYGMPLFEFYAPLPYYVGTAFYWVGVNIIVVMKLLFFLCSAISFVGMYLLGAKLFGRSGGILAAIAFTLAPYRALNLYVRGALSEAWGMMALPWVVLGMVCVIRKEKNGWLILLGGLVVLFLSHNLTTLLFFPITGALTLGYWFMRWWPQKKKTIADILPLVQFSLAYALAVGISAFYLFPAYLEKDFTRVDLIMTGYFNYTNHFLLLRQFFEDKWGYGGSAPWPYNGISFFFGYGQWIGFAVTALLVLFLLFKVIKQRKRIAVVWPRFFFYGLLMVLLAFTIFMMTRKSQFIWDALPFMVAVQFPWRWLSAATTLLSLIIGFGVTLIPRRSWRFLYVAVVSGIILVTSARYFQPEFYLKDPQNFYYTDPTLIRVKMSQVLNDYVPKQIPFLPDAVMGSYKTDGAANAVTVLVDRTQEKLWKTNFNSSTKMELYIADFPGWKLFLDGKEIPRQRGPIGDYVVTVPAGEHMLGAQFADSPIRWWSDVASAISVCVFAFLLLYRQKNQLLSQVERLARS